MGPGRLDHSLGLERIARGAFTMLIEGLNDELQVQQEAWSEEDESLADLRGLPYDEVQLEPIETRAFHLGDAPTLLDDSTPLSDYPAVSVMAYRVGPGGDSQDDHASSFRDQLYVEAFVKASPQEGEEVCNLRAWRTADAINNVIMRDITLGGSCDPLSEDPTAVVSEVFTRSENPNEATGDKWFWKAARVEYAVAKYSPFESD